MSGCPSVRARNTGSGYVKTGGGGGDISLAARLAERDAQDRAAQFRVTEAAHPTPHHPSVSGATRAGTSSVTNTSQLPEKR